MRPLMIVFVCLGAVWPGGLIFGTPKAEASLAKPSNLPAKRLDALPQEIRPISRPQAIPATIKREKQPGEAPLGPPIRRGKGLAQAASQCEDFPPRGASR